MKFVCTSCGSVYRIENTGGVEPPKSDPCPCPPPHKTEPDWQRAFCEADTARCKLEGELEREREISDRFQRENNTLTMKCNALEETLEKEIEDRRRAENEVKLLKDNYARLEGEHGKLIAQIRNLRSWL